MTAGELLGALLLLAGNAFFVAAEFSAISVRRAMLEPLAETHARARRVLEAMRSLSMLLAGAQLGITLCSLGLGAVAEPAVSRLIEGGFSLLGVPEALLHPIAFAIALTLVVFLHMVLGEMVPKNLALASPERLAMLMVPVLAGFVRIVRPLIVGLNGTANAGLRLLSVEPKSELDSSHTSEELAGIIAESRSEGLLDEDEHGRLTGALALESLRARDVMIPLPRLVSVAPSISADELEDLAAETGYSRFPVLKQERTDGRSDNRGESRMDATRNRSRLNPTRALPALAGRARAGAVRSVAVRPGRSDPRAEPRADELAGFVHAKDVLGLGTAARRQPLAQQRLRVMPALRTDLPLSEVLTELQRLGSHLGQVQENGRTVGVIALEDVVEAFVGEVEDASHLDADLDPQPSHRGGSPSPASTPAAGEPEVVQEGDGALPDRPLP